MAKKEIFKTEINFFCVDVRIKIRENATDGYVTQYINLSTSQRFGIFRYKTSF